MAKDGDNDAGDRDFSSKSTIYSNQVKWYKVT